MKNRVKVRRCLGSFPTFNDEPIISYKSNEVLSNTPIIKVTKMLAVIEEVKFI